VFVSACYVALQRVLQCLVLCFPFTRVQGIRNRRAPHELAVLHRQIGRPSLRTAGWVLLAAVSRLLPRHLDVVYRQTGTKRTCTNAPMVYVPTRPSSQATNRITASAYHMPPSPVEGKCKPRAVG
jgi:hypothetical protein